MDKDIFDQRHQSTKEDEHSKALSSAKPKSYTTLRAKMTPESRTRSEDQTRKLLLEMQVRSSAGK